MSIVIPGMEMPKSCEICPFVDDDFLEDYFGLCCSLTKERPHGHERLDTCPLIELPPHGRLCDLDSLKEIFADELNRYKQIPLDNDDKQETALLHLESAMRIITNAPTIIPAEEE